jgi:hypothetical protein
MRGEGMGRRDKMEEKGRKKKRSLVSLLGDFEEKMLQYDEMADEDSRKIFSEEYVTTSNEFYQFNFLDVQQRNYAKNKMPIELSKRKIFNDSDKNKKKLLKDVNDLIHYNSLFYRILFGYDNYLRNYTFGFHGLVYGGNETLKLHNKKDLEWETLFLTSFYMNFFNRTGGNVFDLPLADFVYNLIVYLSFFYQSEKDNVQISRISVLESSERVEKFLEFLQQFGESFDEIKKIVALEYDNGNIVHLDGSAYQKLITRYLTSLLF